MTKRIKDLTEEQREKRRAYQRKNYANLTEEQREKRRAYQRTEEQREKKRANNRKYYANLTEEQKRKYYPPLTEEQREKRRAYQRTEEQREKRRSYRANLTEEQYEKRRAYQRKYYANLTEEQREKRRATRKKYFRSSSGLPFFKRKLGAIRIRQKKQILKDKLAGNGKKQGITLASIEVDVSPEYLMSIFPKDGKCPVLNIPFTYDVEKNKRYRNMKSYASLDRVDNNKGYIKGNVVWVSWIVNTVKRDLTLEELFKISQFYMNWKKKCHEEK